MSKSSLFQQDGIILQVFFCCHLFFNYTSVLADIIVLCGKLVGGWGGLMWMKVEEDSVVRGGEMGRSQVRTLSSQNNSLLL